MSSVAPLRPGGAGPQDSLLEVAGNGAGAGDPAHPTPPEGEELSLCSFLTSPKTKDKCSINSFSRAILYCLKVLKLTLLSKQYPFLFFSGSERPEGRIPGAAAPSKPALHGQQPHRGLLHGPVDARHLPLGQRPLHVAVGDAVAVAGLVCPREYKRKAVSEGHACLPPPALTGSPGPRRMGPSCRDSCWQLLLLQPLGRTWVEHPWPHWTRCIQNPWEEAG